MTASDGAADRHPSPPGTAREPSTDPVTGDAEDRSSEHRIRTSTRWVAALFMIGSACFAVASIPAFAEIVPGEMIGATYFAGSIFFTSAALLVAATTWQDDRVAAPDVVAPALRNPTWWAAIIQFVGTIWFNINTFNAMDEALTVQQTNLRIWTPDFFGSICFLVSSAVSWWVVCRGPWCWCRPDAAWRSTALNLLGSVFFMLAAIAAYTLPSTGDLLDASVANSGTLLGALCFFWGARLLLVDQTNSATSSRPSSIAPVKRA